MGSSRVRWWPAVVLLLAGARVVVAEPGGDALVPPPLRPGSHAVSCKQWASSARGARQEDTFVWALNVSSVPGYLDRDAATRAIEEATRTVARARSGCVESERLAPTLPRVVYAGPTTRSANVTPDAACFPSGNSDGINVVSFGQLPGGVAAVSCTYVDRGDIWQSDVMLNDTPGKFTLAPRDQSCRDSFDLRAVMTHERGHSFGLGHVPEAPATYSLTMSSFMDRCDPSARRLGSGDVAGLDRIY